MRQPESKRAISRDQYDAVLLDLDGVITDTATVHATCWKQMFDEYLQKTRDAERRSISSLRSRHGLPALCGWEAPLRRRSRLSRHRAVSNSPREALTTLHRRETVGGLGNRKNDLVNKVIAEVGVEPYEGSVKLIHQLRRRGFKIAVVTSSQNCTAVLKAAKLDDFFDVQVDGNMIHAQHLAGKPAPDTFLMAAKLLGVEPTRAVVVEDAISGVEAGSAGNFGLVIGVARKGNAEELQRHGAHLVVNDLGELVD